MKLFTIQLLIFMMMSCTKTNVTFKHHWQAEAGHDNQNMNHAFFCDAADYLGTDTVELDNTKEYDSTKFGATAGSIVMDPKSVDGNRYYHKLLSQID